MEPNNVAPTGRSSGSAPQDQAAQTEVITSKPDTTSSQPSPIDKPTKSSKPLIWILAILAVIAIAAAGVFAYLYFTKPTTPPSEPSEETSQETPPEETAEETEITDTYILRDLDEKMAILHNTDETGPLIKKLGVGYGYVSPLYKNGNLSEIAKLAHIFMATVPDYILTSREIESAIAEQGYDKDSAQDFSTTVHDGIKGDTMAAKYKDLFGEDLVKGAANGEYYCPGAYYNSQYDFYYNPTLGCGGTGPYFGVYYKNKYTTDGEHAYVYVSAGTFNAEDNKTYCDIFEYGVSEQSKPAVCGEAENPDSFTINESNYQKFAEYRFVFNKADDGTYYFVKAEKL
ncbi:hypothetical protein IKE98_01255 [Candidatus Saccharibacteria bacterium]|nr:hypothetical protein [Candidatus Saccharibacteria bacterium]